MDAFPLFSIIIMVEKWLLFPYFPILLGLKMFVFNMFSTIIMVEKMLFFPYFQPFL